MPTPLDAPFNVTTTKTSDTTIKVTWDDKNADNKVSKPEITFLKKGSLTPFTPQATTVGTATAGEIKDGVTPYSVEITRDGTAPTAADLASSYIARVVDKPVNTTENEESAPGLQAYWEFSPSLTVMVGDSSFTLTKSSGPGGVYRLPVSRTKPFQITIADVKKLARAAGLSEDSVPSKWPNGQPITGSLNLYKLAIDVDRKLLALDIAFDLSFTPFAGLTVKEVGLIVLRTDGTSEL